MTATIVHSYNDLIKKIKWSEFNRLIEISNNKLIKRYYQIGVITKDLSSEPITIIDEGEHYKVKIKGLLDCFIVYK